MKIIHRGTIPGERVYKSTCTNCKTVCEYLLKEATIVYDQRDGNYVTIACPVCDQTCYGSEVKTKLS